MHLLADGKEPALEPQAAPRLTARNLLPLPPHRKRSEPGRAREVKAPDTATSTTGCPIDGASPRSLDGFMDSCVARERIRCNLPASRRVLSHTHL